MNIKLRIIKQELDKRRLTQKELAKKMGYSPGLISQYLNSEDAPDSFFQVAAMALDSPRLKMLVFGDTTEPIYFDQAYISTHSTLDKMEEEASQILDYIQELKRKRNYHNTRKYDECSKDLKRAYQKLAEKNKDLNHCTEHLDIALDDFGMDLSERDRVCNMKYIDRGLVSIKTTIKKDTCSPQASVL